VQHPDLRECSLKKETAHMAVMLSRTYDALVSAGAPEEKARAAAEELAAYETRFAKIETDLAVLKWMVGVNLAASLSLVIKAFT
jgi:hypothetical protein